MKKDLFYINLYNFLSKTLTIFWNPVQKYWETISKINELEFFLFCCNLFLQKEARVPKKINIQKLLGGYPQLHPYVFRNDNCLYLFFLVKLHREVHFHANIINFYGISKKETSRNRWAHFQLFIRNKYNSHLNIYFFKISSRYNKSNE